MGTATRLMETEAAEIAGIRRFMAGRKRLEPGSAPLPVCDPSAGEPTVAVGPGRTSPSRRTE